jgi:N-acetylmuramoyl-L-alanine amidase
MRLLLVRGLPILFLLLCAASGWASDIAERDYQKAREGYNRLLASGERQKFRDNWVRVIDGFLKVSERHAARPQGPAALYMAAKAQEGLWSVSRRPSDARQAADLYDRLVDQFPTDRHADDALVLGGEIYERILADRAEAYRRYRKAVDAYPKGDMTATARKGVTRLAAYAPRETPPPPALSTTLSSPLQGTELTGIRFWSNPGYTRVVLDLSGSTAFNANVLPADASRGLPPRVYVDLKGAVPIAHLPDITAVDDGLLRQVRTGRYDTDTIRIVLDLVSLLDYKVIPLEDPARIVIDVQGENQQLSSNKPEIRSAPPAPKDEIGKVLGNLSQESVSKKTAPSAGGNLLRRIVIDPGHGGKDPGAIGPTGVKEKDVNLAMARVLARKLKEELGCEVILTRDKDIFLPLEERTAIANRVGADLFISIHANAALNRTAYGIETYYLNFSQNERAAAVAARENGTSLKQVGDLELILFDLMANSKINESSRLAAEVHRALIDDLSRHFKDIRDLGVRQGPFYVLLGATMPSVLIETAFISHPREEARLLDPRYHEKAANAIVRGVRSFAESQRMIATR